MVRWLVHMVQTHHPLSHAPKLLRSLLLLLPSYLSDYSPPFCFLTLCFIRDLSFHLWSLTRMAERSFKRTSHSSAQNLTPSKTRSPGQVPESPGQFVPCNIIKSDPSDLFLLRFATGIRSPCRLWSYLSCSYFSWALELSLPSTERLFLPQIFIYLVHPHFLKVFP